MPPALHRSNEQNVKMYSEYYDILRMKNVVHMTYAYPMHYHDFVEVFYFISGNVMYTIGSNSYRLVPGDILIIPPRVMHQPMSEETSTYSRMVLSINFEMIKALSMNEDLTLCFMADSPTHVDMLRLKSKDSASILTLMEQLWDETTQHKSYMNTMSNALLVAILVQLNRFSANAPKSVMQGKLCDTLSRVADYINSHINERLQISDLAEQFYISRNHLSRAFKKQFGMGVHEYVLERKMIFARKLLHEGLSATNVARSCGFTEYATFYRAFKQTFGVAPVEFAEESESKDYYNPHLVRGAGFNVSGTSVESHLIDSRASRFARDYGAERLRK